MHLLFIHVLSGTKPACRLISAYSASVHNTVIRVPLLMSTHLCALISQLSNSAQPNRASHSRLDRLASSSAAR
jgi:hypothetical protein